MWLADKSKMADMYLFMFNSLARDFWEKSSEHASFNRL